MLSAKFLRRYRDKEVPFGEVGYVTYKRTYSRLIPGAGRTEEWNETLSRVVNGLVEIGGVFTPAELERLYDVMFHIKGTCAGRALWQLGTANMRRIGSDSLMNCWHFAVDELEVFCETFNQLMLGGGVGFNITPEYVYALPRVKGGVEVALVDNFDCDYIVTDNREGWIDLLRKTLHAFFVTGVGFTYCTRAIRPRGSEIKTFGGRASGSKILEDGIKLICEILRKRAGQKLRPIDCLDILNILGMIVVSGNVRRSAEIGLGAPNDIDFILAKNWAIHSIPNWRVQSNNTIVTDQTDNLPREFWYGYEGTGEPYGLFNLALSRRFGRLADGAAHRPDPDVAGTNPCGEQSLASHECCCLAEIFLPRIENEDEFKEVSSLLYKVNKTFLKQKFSNKRTQEIVHKHMRMGIGITGFVEAPHMHNEELFDRVYKNLELVDSQYSYQLGLSPSIKLTTVKPSGTASLLAGVTPGAHNGFSEFVIRRIRFDSADPLVDIARKNGYHVEPMLNADGTRNPYTMVVEFPMKYAEGIPTEQEPNAIEQLERQKWLQTNWSDNAVSITVYYRKEELPAIQEWLAKNYTTNVKACSFLLHQGHGFVQAPLERITEEDYWQLKACVTPITGLVDDQERSFSEGVECEGGACPVR